VPDQVKSSFVIFDIWALWRSATHMATVGVFVRNISVSCWNSVYA